jgi:RNA polymerase sigma factor (sigma-70 family)
MSTSTTATANGRILHHLDQLFGGGTATGLTDAQLLRRFVSERDEGSFAVLIERHGPMVLGVCRRRLGCDAAAIDDAFQATFLILVRKAAELRQADRLAPWLFGVALRVSGRARQQSLRRRSIEGQLLTTDQVVSTGDVAALDLDQAETRRILDEELGRLPAKLRDVVVLCYLEGHTHEQAADRLACPVGTVRSRLSAAREALRRRLVRRGLGGSAAALAAVFELSGSPLQAAVPPALAAATVRMAIPVLTRPALAGVVPAAVAAIVEGASHTMSWTKMSIAVGLIAILGTGGSMAWSPPGGSTAPGAAGAGTTLRDTSTAGGPQAGGSPSDPALAKTPQQSLFDFLLGVFTGSRQQAEAERDRAEAARRRALEAELQARVVALQKLDQEAALRDELKRAREREAELTKQVQDLEKALDLAQARGITNDPFRAQPPGNPNTGTDPFGRPPAGGFPGFAGAPPGVVPFPQSKLRTMMTGSIILLQPKNENQVIAHSYATGKFASYTLPAGVRATPILSSGKVAALQLEGESIGELCVFFASDGRWHRQPLEPPGSGKVVPILAGELVAYAVGNRVYAFSGLAGRWDKLTLRHAATPVVDGSRVFVEDDGMLAVFSAQTGTWSTIEPENVESGGP